MMNFSTSSDAGGAGVPPAVAGMLPALSCFFQASQPSDVEKENVFFVPKGALFDENVGFSQNDMIQNDVLIIFDNGDSLIASIAKFCVYIARRGRGPSNVWIHLPSCLPATSKMNFPLTTSGYVFSRTKIHVRV